MSKQKEFSKTGGSASEQKHTFPAVGNSGQRHTLLPLTPSSRNTHSHYLRHTVTLALPNRNARSFLPISRTGLPKSPSAQRRLFQSPHIINPKPPSLAQEHFSRPDPHPTSVGLNLPM